MSATSLKDDLDLYKQMLDNTINMKYYRAACKAAQKKHLAMLQSGHTPPKQQRPIASPTSKKSRRSWVPVPGAGVHKASNWETAKKLFLPSSVEGKQAMWVTEAPSNAWMKGGTICIRRFKTTDIPVYRRRILKDKQGTHVPRLE